MCISNAIYEFLSFAGGNRIEWIASSIAQMISIFRCLSLLATQCFCLMAIVVRRKTANKHHIQKNGVCRVHRWGRTIRSERGYKMTTKKWYANRQCCHYVLQMEANEDIWVKTTTNQKPQSYYVHAHRLRSHNQP